MAQTRGKKPLIRCKNEMKELAITLWLSES